MPTPTIIRGSDHMYTSIYSGNGQGQRVGRFLPFTDSGTISKSLMFDHASSSYLERTQDTVSGDDNKRKATFSWWFKQTGKRFGNETCLFAAGPGGRFMVRFDTSQRMTLRLTNSTTEYEILTNRSFEDRSKWYHCVWQIDASQSTAANRSRLWVDGDEITSWSSASYPAQNTDVVGLADGTTFRIGSLSHSALQFFDGYMAEFNCISGSIVDVSTFGLTDTSTGRWIPKTLTGITYGTNGFRTTFANTAGLTIGDDTSGNTNDLSLNGIGTDHIKNDTPTNNLPTMIAYDPALGEDFLSEGGTRIRYSGTNVGYPFTATLTPDSGKWYAEVRSYDDGGGSVVTPGMYIMEDMHFWDGSYNFYPGGRMDNGDGCGAGIQIDRDGNYYVTSSSLSASIQDTKSGQSIAAGDVLGLAIDRDNSTLDIYNNSGSLIGRCSILRPGSVSFTAMATGPGGGGGGWDWNFGDNGTFNGLETAGGNTDEDGNGNFYHSVPSGFKMLKQDSMPETNRGLTDMIWFKNRDNSGHYHTIYDSTRGIEKEIYPSTTDAQATQVDGLKKFLKGGAEIEDAVNVNNEQEKFVAWNWVANGGTTSANTDGSGASIASTTQANQTAGFSIVSHTGTGSAGTIAHGLSQRPEWIITKQLGSSGTGFMVYHVQLTSGYYQQLATAAAEANDVAVWNSTTPTNKVFSVGSQASVNGSSKTYISYCWHHVRGYSHFGRYKATGDANGIHINIGFKPAWLMIKAKSTSNSWKIIDSTRFKFNPFDDVLNADQNNAESDQSLNIDFLSNGFNVKTTGTYINETNQSNQVYIYMAFAKNPFEGDGVNPTTAI